MSIKFKTSLLFGFFPSRQYSKIQLSANHAEVSKLHPQNWARAVVTHFFLCNIKFVSIDPKKTKIGVIGGTKVDPEIKGLQNLVGELDVKFFGIEN